MLTLSAGRIAQVCGGDLVYGSSDAVANGVSIDSRDVPLGCAFVAVVGDRVDGHDYVGDALSRGARVAIVTRYDEQIAASVEAT